MTSEYDTGYSKCLALEVLTETLAPGATEPYVRRTRHSAAEVGALLTAFRYLFFWAGVVLDRGAPERARPRCSRWASASRSWRAVCRRWA